MNWLTEKIAKALGPLFARNKETTAPPPNKGTAYFVTYPDYKAKDDFSGISLPTGHAGVMLVSPNGLTKYYEYGRYNPQSHSIVGEKLDAEIGNYRKINIPNYNGNNMQDIANVLKQSAHQDRILLTEIPGIDFNKALNYVNERMNADEDTRKELYDYNLLTNNCGTFANDVIRVGGQYVIEPIIKSPVNYTRKLKNRGYKTTEYEQGGTLFKQK